MKACATAATAKVCVGLLAHPWNLLWPVCFEIGGPLQAPWLCAKKVLRSQTCHRETGRERSFAVGPAAFVLFL